MVISMSSTLAIDTERLREAALKVGIINPTQLKEASGLDYKTCYLVWNGEYVNLTLNSLSKLLQALNLLDKFKSAPLMKLQKG